MGADHGTRNLRQLIYHQAEKWIKDGNIQGICNIQDPVLNREPFPSSLTDASTTETTVPTFELKATRFEYANVAIKGLTIAQENDNDVNYGLTITHELVALFGSHVGSIVPTQEHQLPQARAEKGCIREEEDICYRTDLNRHQVWTSCRGTPYLLVRQSSQGEAAAIGYEGSSIIRGKAGDGYPITSAQHIDIVLTKVLVKLWISSGANAFIFTKTAETPSTRSQPINWQWKPPAIVVVRRWCLPWVVTIASCIPPQDLLALSGTHWSWTR
jgi:hypothetical protein